MRLSAKMLVMGALAAAAIVPAQAEKLVLLHTNDTHSQIDPFDDDNLGGVARRKVVIDSVRAAEPHVLLIDAGDAVQGSLFFTLFGGEVEERMLNALGYDIRILGNHEFDNGIDSIGHWMRMSNAELIATNYDMRGTRTIGKLFKPYTIKEVNGRRIGFIGINRDPEGLARVGTYDGVKYTDAIEAANAAAWWLKNIEHCDAVVAVTHIGYKVSDDIDDVTLAKNSRDIDVIIGGHSHTTIDPATEKGREMGHIVNAVGDTVLVAQTGKGARNLGVVEIDLATLKPSSRFIAVDKRLDSRVDRDLTAVLDSYRQGVDSLNAVRVATSAIPLEQGSPELLNYVTDFVLERGRELAPDVDMAMMNRGGLRRSLPKGDISEGHIIMMMPFYNYIDVIEIKGSDLLDAFDVTAAFGGQGVSSNVRAKVNPATKKASDVTLDGKPVDPDKTYRLATIDYLSAGGDYMKPLTRGKVVAQSPNVIYNDLMDYMRRSNKKINPSGERRVTVIK